MTSSSASTPAIDELASKVEAAIFASVPILDNMIVWSFLFGLIFFLFYLFSSPFVENRSIKNKMNSYVYFCLISYVWLGSAVGLHLPFFHFHSLESKIPISLFTPLLLASAITQLLCEGLLKILNRWFVYHAGWKQNSLEIFQNSVVVSVACCLVYNQCGISSSLSEDSDSRSHAICFVLFHDKINSSSRHLPSVLVLWSTAMSIIILNFALERLSMVRGVFVDVSNDSSIPYRRSSFDSTPGTPEPSSPHNSLSPVSSSHSFTPDSISQISRRSTLFSEFSSSLPYFRQLPVKLRDSLFNPKMLDMVSWYHLLTAIAALDLLIHLGLFVGRFDQRTLLAAMPNSNHYLENTEIESEIHSATHNKKSKKRKHKSAAYLLQSNILPHIYQQANSLPPSISSPIPHVHRHHLDDPFYYDHFSVGEEFWFDWMSDCGDGWNSSYQVARLLAQPELNVSVRRRNNKRAGTLTLPRGKLLVLGGDLAYPNPSIENYESRFFGPFQCAMPPPINYESCAISTSKPGIAGSVSALRSYAGPQMFTIPGNHDWFDGLQNFLRVICSRDWLGGWLMPQEKSWFAIHLPHNWWIFGLDNALSDDIDSSQFRYFSSIAANLGPDDRVILACHEPDWIINAHDKVEFGSNINYLMRILKGKVVLRIAGDIHNYTRHMPGPQNPASVAEFSSATAPSTRSNSGDSLAPGPEFNKALRQEDPGWSPLNLLSCFYRLIKKAGQVNLSSSTIFLEDIIDEVVTSSTINRTQSMPALNRVDYDEEEESDQIGLGSDSNSFAENPGSLSNSPLSFNRPDSPDPDNSLSPDRSPSPEFGQLSNLRNRNLRSPVKLAKPKSPTTIPSLWTSGEVATWLASIELSILIPSFKSNLIDGALLLELADEDLNEEIGISSAIRRKKILLEIAKLRARESAENINQLRNEFRPIMMDATSSPIHRAAKANNNSANDSQSSDRLDLGRTLSGEPFAGKKNKKKKKKRAALAANENREREEKFTSAASDGESDEENSQKTTQAFSEPISSPPPLISPPVCIVSGGGGAFMHGTHVPDPGPIDVHGERYVRACSYPAVAVSRAYALLNIFGFRKRNWRFDIVGGFLYFAMVYSRLPLCNLNSILSSPTLLELIKQFAIEVFAVQLYLFQSSYFSLFFWLALLLILWSFNHAVWPAWKRILVGTIHCCFHSLAAFTVLVFMETCMELGLKKGVIGNDNLYQVFVAAFPSLLAPLQLADSYSWGFTTALIRFLTAMFDIPDAMANLKTEMCSNPDSMSRLSSILYYSTHGVYYWVLATPVTSFIFGSYLYVGSTFLNAHMTEAFSSLRIESYKNFIRFHINKNGDLEVYSLGIDRCPRRWVRDGNWSGFSSDEPAWKWKTPSLWKPARGQPDRIRLIDYIVLKKNKKPSNNGNTINNFSTTSSGKK